jgi:serine/threonine-protein kinase
MDPTNLTPAGDQYSLGCTLYFFLTGQFPFPDGTAAEKMMAHQFKEPTPIRELAPDVPTALAEVVERLMKKAPEARYASAGEAVEALRPHAGGAPAGVKPAARPQPAAAEAPHAAPEPAARSAAPSAPTPKPQGQVALPSRNSIRGKGAPPAPAAAPAKVKQASESNEIPPEAVRPAWEQKLGPVGIAVIAVAACAIGWAVTMFLF